MSGRSQVFKKCQPQTACRIILQQRYLFERSYGVFNRVVQFTYASLIFQKSQLFNQVQFRGIRRQPNHKKAMVEQT